MRFRTKARDLLAREGIVALVTLSRVEGSSPREEGAQMLVTSSGFIGSIGGGTLEWQAMAEAQKLLRAPSVLRTAPPSLRAEGAQWGDLHSDPPSPRRGVGGARRAEGASSRTYSLGPDLGQCCGGRVTITTAIITTPQDLEQALTPEPEPRQVLLYGAGHVGKSLILLLAQAPLAVTWIDPRPGAFPTALPANVSRREIDDVLRPLASAAEGAIAIVMSHSHALDFEVTDAALRTANVARVLLIGSATKRARFLSRLRAAGHGEEALGRLVCPIGDGAISGKTPYAVALSTAHQLVSLDEALATPQTTSRATLERRAG